MRTPALPAPGSLLSRILAPAAPPLQYLENSLGTRPFHEEHIVAFSEPARAVSPTIRSQAAHPSLPPRHCAHLARNRWPAKETSSP